VYDLEVLINITIKKISKVFLTFLKFTVLPIVENLVAHQYFSFIYASSLRDNEVKFDINYLNDLQVFIILFKQEDSKVASYHSKRKN